MKESNTNRKKISNPIIVPIVMGVICICVILSVLVMPKKTTASQLQENLELGSKYLEAGEYSKAEVAFNDVLKIDKKSIEATMGLAKVYNGKKQPDKALDMLQKTGENMKSVSETEVMDKWMDDYKNTFEETKSLLAKDEKLSQLKSSKKAEDRIKDYISGGIKPTSEPGKIDGGSENGMSGSDSQKAENSSNGDQESGGDHESSGDQESNGGQKSDNTAETTQAPDEMVTPEISQIPDSGENSMLDQEYENDSDEIISDENEYIPEDSGGESEITYEDSMEEMG